MSLKDTSYKVTNKISKNQSINELTQNLRISQGKNGLSNVSNNNNLRRKMILSVDMNNKKNIGLNISQLNDININLKLINDTHIENNKNHSNTTCYFNNNTSNRSSN